AVQAVFLKVVERGQTFRGESSALTWLYGIATLHCLQQLRNRARHERRLRAEGQSRSEAQPPTLDERLTVLALLDGADEALQQMVFLRHVDGMTVEEVAEVVGFSRKTVTRKLQAFAISARGRLAPAG